MTIALIAAVSYVVAAAALVAALQRAPRPRWLWLSPALLAIALHTSAHAVVWREAAGADLHFFAALSLVGLGMAALTTIVGASGRMAALGVAVFPIAALVVLVYGYVGPTQSQPLDWRLQLHAWSALLAYATLAVAALLAVMSWLQERALRRHQLRDWMRALPPLVELETLTFRTIKVGFALLTAALLTGVLFVEDLFSQQLVHKTVLSALSWLTFGALLLGRWRRGWRGEIALRWTLVAMGLLVLAFFGSKFVVELVLQRG